MSIMNPDYKVGDLVWAKLKGYPWWPARIENETMLSQKVVSKKPKNPKTIWPVFFFGSNDYGWFGKDCLRPFVDGLAEYGSLNKKGSLFATAMREAQAPQLPKGSNNQDLSEIMDSPKLSSDPPKESSLSKNNKRASLAGLSTRKKKRQSVSASSPEEPKSKRANLESIPQNEDESAENTKTSCPSESGVYPSFGNNDSLPADAPKCETISPVPSADLHDEIGIEELKAIRQSLQKATLKEGYNDVELVDHYLSKLENARITAALIRESKVGKLMRYLVANNIPENAYNFKSRFRALLTRYKQYTLEAQEARGENNQNASNSDTLTPSKASSNHDGDASELQTKEETVQEAPLPPSNGVKASSPATEQGLPHVPAKDSSLFTAEDPLPE